MPPLAFRPLPLRLSKGKASEIVRCCLSFATSGEEGPCIGLQQGNPSAYVSGMAKFTVIVPLGAKEGSAKLSNKFFRCIRRFAEPTSHSLGAIKLSLRSGPMP